MHLFYIFRSCVLTLFTVTKDRGSEIVLHDSTLHICIFTVSSFSRRDHGPAHKIASNVNRRALSRDFMESRL